MSSRTPPSQAVTPLRSKPIAGLEIERRIGIHVSLFRRCLCCFWNNLLSCWLGSKSRSYRPLPQVSLPSPSPPPPPPPTSPFSLVSLDVLSSSLIHLHNKDASDLVSLKITVLGDSLIGKTCFLTKYAGRNKAQGDLQAYGLSRMDKTIRVQGARICYALWEVGSDESGRNYIPMACKDSEAMLFMFDLTSRCTLNGVINWYQRARKCNQAAIPVLIGTKFDDFVQMPIDLQWAIASQARASARAMKAPLFFSSATYNINVNKIFKFITAKLFDLQWELERKLTVGEPIIDF